MNKVYINKSFYSEFGERWDFGLIDLVKEALENFKNNLAEIEAVYVGNMLANRLQGQGHLNAIVTSLLGRDLPVMVFDSACASGGVAVSQAWQAVKMGIYANVLVLGVEKMTDNSVCDVTTALMAAATEDERFNGATFPALYGLVAQEYLQKHGLNADIFNQAALVAHDRACSDPKAQFRKKLNLAEIEESNPVSLPLRVLHCAPISDGVAAVILSKNVSTIELMWSQSLTSAQFSLAERKTRTEFRVVQNLIKRLYTDGNLSSQEIDLLEVHDCFSIAAIVAMEDLGFADKGKGAESFCNSAVNVRGGLKAGGHAIGATGVKQVAVLAQEMEANIGYKKALAHNVGGVGGSVALSYLKRI